MYPGLKFLIGAELGGVLLYIVRNQRIGFIYNLSRVYRVQKLRIQLMIPLCVGFVREYPRLHRAVGEHFVNRVVDSRNRRASLERPKGQIIVPGDHGEPAILLIQIVVVDHISGVAVAVDDEVMDDKIAEHRLDVQDLLQIFIAGERF